MVHAGEKKKYIGVSLAGHSTKLSRNYIGFWNPRLGW